MGIVIKGIDAVVFSVEQGQDLIQKTDLYIEGNAIAGINERPHNFIENEVIDGRDRLVIPGLINGHTHSYMTLMRNVADDLSFMDWLFGRIDPIEQKMTAEDAYWGANLALLEMMKSGTTCINDMQMHIHQTSKAVMDSGMRGVIARGLVGSGADEAGSSRLREAYEEMDAFQGCDRLTYRLGPHAPYTCDEAFLKIVAREAESHQLGIHIHLAESDAEIQGTQEKYGCSPIELARRCKLFEQPCVVAHAVKVSAEDLDILKEYGVSVVTNPASNMKLGNGFAPIPEMLDKGINVCIGTDGAASNNSQNLFSEMRLMALVHKGVHRTPQCVSAREIYAMATRNAATALGLSEKVGTIEVGKRADLVILNKNMPSMMPCQNLISALSYSATGNEVETVIINGRVTMRNRQVLTMDEEKIYYQIKKIAKRLGLED